MRSLDAGNKTQLISASNSMCLSIIVDDFDSQKSVVVPCESQSDVSQTTQQSSPKPYLRQSSDLSIKKILEEKEHRREEFLKLLEEHNAVVEKLKKIESKNSTKSATATFRI